MVFIDVIFDFFFGFVLVKVVTRLTIIKNSG